MVDMSEEYEFFRLKRDVGSNPIANRLKSIQPSSVVRDTTGLRAVFFS